jgi:hypothetical protein
VFSIVNFYFFVGDIVLFSVSFRNIRQNPFGLEFIFAAGELLNYLPAIIYHLFIAHARQPTHFALGNGHLKQSFGLYLFRLGKLLELAGGWLLRKSCPFCGLLDVRLLLLWRWLLGLGPQSPVVFFNYIVKTFWFFLWLWPGFRGQKIPYQNDNDRNQNNGYCDF